jgi:hypothetical protein
MTTQERATLDAMMKYGGNFVRALERAYVSADPENRQKIRETWRIEWAKYERMAEDTAKARAQ